MHRYGEVMHRFADEIGSDSPFYASLARGIAADDGLLDRIVAVPPGRHHPTLLFAAVHDLVLGGVDHPVAEHFRAARPDPRATASFRAACDDLWPEIEERLRTRGTQTNEPNRAAVIRLALIAATSAAACSSAPVGLVDVGTSAGLNLLLDRYGYDYGSGVAGDPSSPVRLSCEIRGGGLATGPDPVVGYRVGIDRAPVDSLDPEQSRWLQACVWPDQPERRERLALALAVLAADPPLIVEGDALEQLPAVLAAVPDDVYPVVTTTWVLAYFPKGDRVAFADLLAETSKRRPLAWVSCEAAGVVPVVPPEAVPPGTTDSVLALARFEGGDVDTRVLGLCHPHGRWVAVPSQRL